MQKKCGCFLKIFLLILGIALLTVISIGLGFWLTYQNVVREVPQLPVAAQPGELGREVNPFIGTGGIPWVCGYNFPGADLPFGVVRLGPETASIWFNSKALNTSGYFYGDNKIIGFSHTRLNGTGATDGGHFLVVPTDAPVSAKNALNGFYLPFSHADEIAFPGYYAVKLAQPHVLVELTATQRVGVQRYTFCENQSPRIYIDISHTLGDRPSSDGKISVHPETGEIEGEIRTFGTFAGRYGGLKVYFVAQFNPEIRSFRIWDGAGLVTNQTRASGNKLGIELEFPENQSVIELKLAISHVSVANARENLLIETGSASFDSIQLRARDAWEAVLNRIKIEGGSPVQRSIFYTALFRTFQMPTEFNDVNGDYIGFDNQVHRAEGFRYFTDLSLWDTFRTTHPLYTLIAPRAQRDVLVSLVEMSRQGGWLPRWPAGHGYTNSMLSTPADMVIAESWLKGIRNFDVEQAYPAMRETALTATPKGARYSGREGIEHFLKYHYCPAELMKEAVSRTFEFCWGDHSIASLAAALGKTEDARLFSGHAEYYRNLWNPVTQYFQPRDTLGNFVEPFHPLLLTYFDFEDKYTNDYVEGSALQWRWGAPFDAEGMIELFKSREYFISELNEFFEKSTPGIGSWNPGPYYWHGNQPDLHAAYLFNAAGRPDLTQKWVRWILENKYSDRFDGLDGNDDGGTLSAWYVFSALGFYPVAGSDQYQLGAPLFPRAELNTGPSRLIILADNYAPENFYVRNVFLNDTLLDRTWISHAELVHGGVLRFEMAAEAGPVKVGK